MPKGQFYALAIFVMGRLGWKVIISFAELEILFRYSPIFYISAPSAVGGSSLQWLLFVLLPIFDGI